MTTDDDTVQLAMIDGRTDADRFDAFRDAHPGWERLSPFEIARLFWNAGTLEVARLRGEETA